MNMKNFNELFILMIILSVFISVDAYSQTERTLGLIKLDESKVFNGYTLFVPGGYKTTYLIDIEGNIVHTWQNKYSTGDSFYLLENGNILLTGKTKQVTVGYMSDGKTNRFRSGGYGGIIQEVDWDGNVVWEYTFSTPEHRQHHDIARMTNGNTLLVAWELKTEEEALAAGHKPELLSQGELWPDMIIEVNPDKEIVWEWHFWDHLSSETGGIANGKAVSNDITDPGKLNINYGPTKADWLHINAVNYNEILDQIVISSRELDEFYVVDHSTVNYDNPAAGIATAAGPAGDILYRWGNPEAYGAGIKADKKEFGHHDIQWIEPGLPGEGNLLIFNNGNGRPEGKYSSVEEIMPPVDGNGNYSLIPGSAYGPAKQAWIYTAPNKTDFYSGFISGCQRLANGNTLVCSGAKGRFFEITLEGEIVWEYINPVTSDGPQRQGTTIPERGNTVFRCYRYAPDFPSLAGRDLTPRGPVELPATTGVNSKVILPNKYYLTQNYPNPFNPETTIEFELPKSSNVIVEIYSGLGQKVKTLIHEVMHAGYFSVKWDGTSTSGHYVASGVYLIRFQADKYTQVKKAVYLK